MSKKVKVSENSVFLMNKVLTENFINQSRNNFYCINSLAKNLSHLKQNLKPLEVNFSEIENNDFILLNNNLIDRLEQILFSFETIKNQFFHHNEFDLNDELPY